MFVHPPQIDPLTIMLHKYMYKIIFLSETSVGRLILLSTTSITGTVVWTIKSYFYQRHQ